MEFAQGNEGNNASLLFLLEMHVQGALIIFFKRSIGLPDTWNTQAREI